MVVLCRIRILCIAIIYIALVRLTVSSADTEANSSYPLWYWFNGRSGHCECCTNKIIYSVICGSQTTNNLEISHGNCMTWNNVTIRMSKLVAVCSYIEIKDTMSCAIIIIMS